MTAEDFKARFDRGPFTYGSILPAIRDSDITKAISEAERTYNADLYPDDTTRNDALAFLSAHFLVESIDAADSGGGSGAFMQTSRSAGGVSEGGTIPDWMMQGELSMFASNYFGRRFLLLTKPHLAGAVYVVSGGTNV